jgi:hypothetical protein
MGGARKEREWVGFRSVPFRSVPLVTTLHRVARILTIESISNLSSCYHPRRQDQGKRENGVRQESQRTLRFPARKVGFPSPTQPIIGRAL